MTTGVATASVCVCHRVCDSDHYHVEEEERLTTTRRDDGSRRREPQRHYDKDDGYDIAMKDRLQERSNNKRQRHCQTSSDY